jgi:thiamine biosynthesis protein ThiS
MGKMRVMKIQLNNKPIMLAESYTLTQLLENQGYHSAAYAVAINHHVIPRAYHTTTLIHEGDVIDVITAMQGG